MSIFANAMRPNCMSIKSNDLYTGGMSSHATRSIVNDMSSIVGISRCVLVREVDDQVLHLRRLLARQINDGMEDGIEIQSGCGSSRSQ